MRHLALIAGLICCMAAGAAEYVGSLRLSSGFTMDNVRATLDDQGNLTLYRVKFARLMPVRVDMMIPHIQCRPNGQKQILRGDNIVPTSNNKPHPDRTILQLQGSAGKQILEFRCTVNGKEMHYSGKHP